MIKKNILFQITILTISLFLFSCASADTRPGRIRAIEKRLETLETKEVANQEIDKLSKKITQGLNLFSQKINNIFSDQSQYLSNLEEITRDLEQLKKDIRKLTLNQEKLLQKLED